MMELMVLVDFVVRNVQEHFLHKVKENK
jgi:hypothetical protein